MVAKRCIHKELKALCAKNDGLWQPGGCKQHPRLHGPALAKFLLTLAGYIC